MLELDVLLTVHLQVCKALLQVGRPWGWSGNRVEDSRWEGPNSPVALRQPRPYTEGSGGDSRWPDAGHSIQTGSEGK